MIIMFFFLEKKKKKEKGGCRGRLRATFYLICFVCKKKKKIGFLINFLFLFF